MVPWSRRAAAAQQAVSRTAGERIYAVGDVHGCYGLLKSLLARINEDLRERPPPGRPLLIFCGDYVDRGPQSAQVLEALVWLRGRTDLQVYLLKGNHEQAMLDYLRDPAAATPWLRFGGSETIAAYGIDPPASDAPVEDHLRARDGLLAAMPASHLRLLEELELMLVVGEYAFVHAGVRPGAALDRQQEEDLLWIRQGFLEWPKPFGKVIVHGHTWRDESPQLLEHRIGIDTGAYATGVLTALRLQDDELEFLQARG